MPIGICFRAARPVEKNHNEFCSFSFSTWYYAVGSLSHSYGNEPTVLYKLYSMHMIMLYIVSLIKMHICYLFI